MTRFAVDLPEYAGPLDLLLELLSEHRLAIEELSIRLVAAQFLDYVERASSFDLDLGGDWIEIAARLVWLKSRSLLPADPELVRRNAQDPAAAELVRLLRRHARSAAGELARRKASADAAFGRIDFEAPEEDDLDRVFTMGDLVGLCEAHALDSRPQPSGPALSVTLEEATVEEAVQWVRSRLDSAAPGRVALDELFDVRPQIPQRICTFLGVLELARQQAAELCQDDCEDSIWVVAKLSATFQRWHCSSVVP